jgi:Xaa-Pro aminopeptidase
MTKIKQRIAQLRQAMKNSGVSACIIPGTDPHASEYIADYWKEREWISGFDGSAGTVAFTLEKGGLWTDSRYFLQGQEQIEGSGIDLMKQGLLETPEMIAWICSELKASERVGVNAQMFSVNSYAAMKNAFTANGIQLISIDLIAEVWTERPALPLKPFYVFDTKYSGQSAADKLTALRAELAKANADFMVLSALDDIAWLYNIRGNDVAYNPVVIAYSLVSNNNATLFIDAEKLTVETKQYLDSQGVAVASYLEIYDALKTISQGKSVLIDGAKLNQSLNEAIPLNTPRRNQMSPVFKLKSIKNDTEVAGIRWAMVKDGVALTRFFMWLEANLSSGKLTEMSISEKLYEFRKMQENFVGESFGTIAGYKGHGAIVHYRATESSDATLKPEGILLLDSGGQYLDGTTDITRTIALGEATRQQKSDFTLVLKGHIALSKAIFPAGTRGSQLDVLARKALWDMGLNYGHGTGHGVGHFLNVHEGPQSIRMDENPAVLQSGMIISNEPGMYRTGDYGIRTENLIHVVPAINTEFGNFLEFETLTLFPIDRNLMEIMLINEEEGEWIDDYHRKVFESLAPRLTIEEQDWLKEKCKPIYDLVF